MEEQYPEHTRLHAVKDKAQVVGEFIEWMHEQGVVFCQFSEHGTQHFESHEQLYNRPIEEIVARFFEIDRDKLEQEKRAMLEDLRSKAQ